MIGSKTYNLKNIYSWWYAFGIFLFETKTYIHATTFCSFFGAKNFQIGVAGVGIICECKLRQKENKIMANIFHE